MDSNNCEFECLFQRDLRGVLGGNIALIISVRIEDRVWLLSVFFFFQLDHWFNIKNHNNETFGFALNLWENLPVEISNDQKKKKIKKSPNNSFNALIVIVIFAYFILQ